MPLKTWAFCMNLGKAKIQDKVTPTLVISALGDRLDLHRLVRLAVALKLRAERRAVPPPVATLV